MSEASLRRAGGFCLASLSAALLMTALAACQAGNSRPAETRQLEYPRAERGPQVDDYHGLQVADPYRWLENLDAAATQDWVAAQNRLSQPYLEAIPSRSWIKRRLGEVWNYERYDVPVSEGGRYFFLRNDGLQNQSVLYVAEGLKAAPRVLLDPNTLSKDATIALAEYQPSPDGRLLAYALSDGGTDWKIWRLRDVATGQDLKDELLYTKFTEVSWDRDSAGFYYSRYPAGAGGRGDDSKQVAIFHHRIGATQSEDRLVYAVTDHPTRNPYGTVSEDGRYLIIDLFDGYDANGIYYLELGGEPGASGSKTPVRLLDDWKALNTFLGSQGSTLYFLSTDAAVNGRILAIDTTRPERSSWRTVVPEADAALESATLVGGQVIASYLRDAHAVVKVFDLQGGLRHEVMLPGSGTVRGFRGKFADPETFFSYTDYLTPAAIYRYDAGSNRVDLFRAPQLDADTAPYVTEQVFFTSKDGTRVPMFITHRRDFVRNSSAPVLLYGYGGFGLASTPAFSSATLVWLEMGGVYAVANLRGGSEYGEAWHEAGTKLKKQNVFDDFAAAARWLIEQRYTSSRRLAILGRSNGGLLVGAVLEQHPELFAAALPGVGVLDMLRYDTASANARQWSSDYGLSENPAQFRALYAYSPYHNARAGVCYPPTLITTADHDDRVVPWHSFKFGAALQHAQGCSNQILVRVETRAGHGSGKPVWMQIEDLADQWAFLTRQLGMEGERNWTSASGER